VLAKEFGAFRRQDHVARLAAFQLADCNRAGVRVEVVHLHARQLAVAAAGFQRRPYQWTEIGRAGI
jgi:hypothetical protein